MFVWSKSQKKVRKGWAENVFGKNNGLKSQIWQTSQLAESWSYNSRRMITGLSPNT